MEKVIEVVKNNKLLVAATVTVSAGILYKTISLNTNKPIFEKDVVYVADFPGINKDLPSYSPFVLKVISILEYCNIRYEINTTGDLGPNPRKTFPYIRYNDEFVYDSYFILEWISQQFKHVTPKMQQSIGSGGGSGEMDQAIDHITKRFIDQAFTYLSAYIRWVVPEYNEKIIPRLLSSIQNPIFRSFAHKAINQVSIQKYKTQVGNFSLDEVVSVFKSDLNSLSNLLGSKTFIFGDHLSMADISLFSTLAQIYYVPVDTPIRSILFENQNLLNYIQNVRSLIFSDAKWELLKQ
ncbi:glutathione S-transferase domain-containing protein [Dictyostelium discoideum AX4]|uniref:Glutathione S-transferase domain-containing protein n=1 Tax=Dictyostelium discoideum TaxID=44689 RepID=Q86JB5_DICDI|nr:glutathione S-transferase domain-containing protein [Dictyostelium discoideum AX4]EAL68951.1 glutathione S-transferase domain-containing protein [Dictyostelium discoideum AX4]|eukprot:XP_642848.1 glutathione S-transferase domain-containing protein [Dictyostelium discoideum AX4]